MQREEEKERDARVAPDLSDPGLNRYMRVYRYYKELILTGKLAPGTRIASATM